MAEPELNGGTLPFNDPQDVNEQKTCYICGSSEGTLRRCIRCQKFYCSAHATPVVPFAHFCENCRPLQVQEAPLVREDVKETYDEVNDKVLREIVVSRCKQITFQGPDASFYSEFISQKDSEALRQYVIFYKTFVSMIEEELLSRQIKTRNDLFRMAGEAKADAKAAKQAKAKVTNGKSAKPTEANADKIKEMLKNLNIDPATLAILMQNKSK